MIVVPIINAKALIQKWINICILSQIYGNLVIKFIIKIKSEETCTALDFNRINSGTFKTRRRNKEALMRDLDLSKLKCRYLQKEFDILQYMLLLSSLIHDYNI